MRAASSHRGERKSKTQGLRQLKHTRYTGTCARHQAGRSPCGLPCCTACRGHCQLGVLPRLKRDGWGLRMLLNPKP